MMTLHRLGALDVSGQKERFDVKTTRTTSTASSRKVTLRPTIFKLSPFLLFARGNFYHQALFPV